jgi:hypothetical protein
MGLLRAWPVQTLCSLAARDFFPKAGEVRVRFDEQQRPTDGYCDAVVHLLRGGHPLGIFRTLARGHSADVGIVPGLPAEYHVGYRDVAPLERAVGWGDTVSATGVRLQKPAVLLCPCGHEPEQHDRVALRYCAATNAHDSPRGCICAAALTSPAARQ